MGVFKITRSSPNQPDINGKKKNSCVKLHSVVLLAFYATQVLQAVATASILCWILQGFDEMFSRNAMTWQPFMCQANLHKFGSLLNLTEFRQILFKSANLVLGLIYTFASTFENEVDPLYLPPFLPSLSSSLLPSRPPPSLFPPFPPPSFRPLLPLPSSLPSFLFFY